VPFTEITARTVVVRASANGPMYTAAVALVEGCEPSTVYRATYPCSPLHCSSGSNAPAFTRPTPGPGGNSAPPAGVGARHRVDTNVIIAESPKKTPPSAPS
jgi:hypothetical protein